jgi:hypothetical protein
MKHMKRIAVFNPYLGTITTKRVPTNFDEAWPEYKKILQADMPSIAPCYFQQMGCPTVDLCVMIDDVALYNPRNHGTLGTMIIAGPQFGGITTKTMVQIEYLKKHIVQTLVVDEQNTLVPFSFFCFKDKEAESLAIIKRETRNLEERNIKLKASLAAGLFLVESIKEANAKLAALKKDVWRCEHCGTTEDVSLQEDPCSADLANDHSLYYLCERCAIESAQNI